MTSIQVYAEHDKSVSTMFNAVLFLKGFNHSKRKCTMTMYAEHGKSVLKRMFNAVLFRKVSTQKGSVQ